MNHVIVIGGGISGLLTAVALQGEGKKVTLLERGELGNVVRSYPVEGDSGTYIVDTGPHILTRLISGPLRSLMDSYFICEPSFARHGDYYLRMNGMHCKFPWALKDFLSFDAVSREERITLIRCIVDGILLPDKSLTVEQFISRYDLAPHTKNLVAALCYFLAGVSPGEVPISRFWDSQKYKDGDATMVKKAISLLRQGTRQDQFYPVGGIQSITDCALASFSGTIVREEATSIDAREHVVCTEDHEYAYDFLVYSGMVKDLPGITEVPSQYEAAVSQLKTTTALAVWVGTPDTIFTGAGSEIWVDTDPPCWVVPTSVYDPELSPEGHQLLGFAFPYEDASEKKALRAIEETLPDLSIDMIHTQVLQPDKAAWTTVPFPSVKSPIPDLYVVGTDTVKKSMGITRASYSVVELLRTLRGDSWL
ncbi:MAG: NAD(P)/FAD-dependent oxidoreductase [Theionarchaea archaeon]|nr:NAD(P)/FAD-dependent oxidoreductase [Theionarchaea archaeon]MBU7019457.1 NAD(P)/FAD-dependent oxidoreductase [Theionarchaea archaeon]